jgi:hypothetical protein
MIRLIKFATPLMKWGLLLFGMEEGFKAYGWQSLENKTAQVFFKKDYEKARLCFDYLMHYKNKLESLTQNTLTKIPILIEDYGLYTNGFSDPLFFRIRLSAFGENLASAEDYTTISFRSVCEDIMVHEATHLYHLTKASGNDDTFRDVFGRVFQPNMFSPGWLIEGLAVYTESYFLDSFSGRLNLGAYKAYVRHKASKDLLPSALEAQYFDVKFPEVSSWYLYGSVFVEYLVNTYGLDALTHFISSYGGGLWLWSLNNAAQEAFHKPFEDLWNEWVSYEKKQVENMVETKDAAQLLSPLEPTYVSLFTKDKDTVYFVKKDLSEIGFKHKFFYETLLKYDVHTKELTELFTTNSSFVSKLSVKDQKLYYVLEEKERGYDNITQKGFGTEYVLMEYDLITTTSTKVYEGPFNDYEVLNDGSFLLAIDNKENYGSSLYRLYEQKLSLYFKSDLKIGGLKVKDSLILLTAKKEGTLYHLCQYKKGEGKLEALVNMPFLQALPDIQSENDIQENNEGSLYFSGNEGGVFHIYEFDLFTKRMFKIHGTKDGFSPLYDKDKNTLYMLKINETGVQIYTLSSLQKHFFLTPFKAFKEKETFLKEEVNPASFLALKKDPSPKALHDLKNLDAVQKDILQKDTLQKDILQKDPESLSSTPHLAKETLPLTQSLSSHAQEENPSQAQVFPSSVEKVSPQAQVSSSVENVLPQVQVSSSVEKVSPQVQVSSSVEKVSTKAQALQAKTQTSPSFYKGEELPHKNISEEPFYLLESLGPKEKDLNPLTVQNNEEGVFPLVQASLDDKAGGELSSSVKTSPQTSFSNKEDVKEEDPPIYHKDASYVDATRFLPSLRLPYVSFDSSVRRVGLQLMNVDLLSYLNYIGILGFDLLERRFIYDLELASLFFNPVTSYLFISNMGTTSPTLENHYMYPLYVSRLSFLNTYKIGLGVFKKTSEFSQKETLGITNLHNASFSHKGTKLSLFSRIDYYAKRWSSMDSILGAYVKGEWGQKILDTGVLNVAGIIDLHMADPYNLVEDLSLRGKVHESYETNMFVYKFEYLYRLARPHLGKAIFPFYYLQEIYLSFFYDLYFERNHQLNDYTYGVTLFFKNFIGLYLPLKIGVTLGLDKKGNLLFPFILNLGLEKDLGDI